MNIKKKKNFDDLVNIYFKMIEYKKNYKDIVEKYVFESWEEGGREQLIDWHQRQILKETSCFKEWNVEVLEEINKNPSKIHIGFFPYSNDVSLQILDWHFGVKEKINEDMLNFDNLIINELKSNKEIITFFLRSNYFYDEGDTGGDFSYYTFKKLIERIKILHKYIMISFGGAKFIYDFEISNNF